MAERAVPDLPRELFAQRQDSDNRPGWKLVLGVHLHQAHSLTMIIRESRREM